MKLFKKTAVLCLILVSIGVACYGNENIKVIIPTYKTIINNMDVDNRYVEYPLISYKDITYFPTTYSLCRNLGFATGFDPSDGFYITKVPTVYYDDADKPFGNSANNLYNKKYDAVIPSYNIYVNGKKTDNKALEYPIINFRDITYFPMTFDFSFVEFGFDISFSENKFELSPRGGGNSFYITGQNGNNVEIADPVSVYTTTRKDDGTVVSTLSSSYTDRYVLNTENDTLTKLGAAYGKITGDNKPDTDGLGSRAKVTGGILYIDGTKICDGIVGEGVNGSSKITGDRELIFIQPYTSSAPPPYTEFKSMLFVKENGTLTNLNIDPKITVNSIIEEEGNIFITANRYSPYSCARWSNDFSKVFVLKDDNTLFDISSLYPDYNSISIFGVYGGKLYGIMKWYPDKNVHERGEISAVNDGYFEIDAKTFAAKKLFPYFEGSPFVTNNGGFYSICNYTDAVNRIVNLKTGKYIEY